MKNKLVSLLPAAAAVALLTLGASPLMAADQGKPAGSVSTSVTRTATVTKIDAKDRWITLKLADGSLVDVQAGPTVKNFAQIKVGDQVVASQEQTVTIEVLPAGQAAPNVTGGSSVVGSPMGAKPMGIVVDTTVVSGTVTAIDYQQRLVTLQGPAGNSRTLQVGPAAKKFDQVKKGDVVVLTLKTATAIEVKAPAKK
ncbi:MAG: hypothetical protein OEW72_10175 [Gammaproteobacteria bacterium]|nr:hypothetical protein [Gammaproteobacteria bacterium]